MVSPFVGVKYINKSITYVLINIYFLWLNAYNFVKNAISSCFI